MEPEISARWRWKIFTQMRRPKLPQAQGALVWLKIILHLHHFSLGQQEQLSKSSHLGSVPRSFQRPCALCIIHSCALSMVHMIYTCAFCALYTACIVHIIHTCAFCTLYTPVHSAHYTQLCILDIIHSSHGTH